MCTGARTHAECGHSGCGCGGHGHPAPSPDPRAILALKFGQPHVSHCQCGGQRCPRHYLAATGFVLGTFLVLHLALNAIAWWPARFQATVTRLHACGPWLPVLEVLLVLVPLAVHLAFGLRTLRREQLRFGGQKHHHGSDLRQWLQRFTAIILLLFLGFHILVMHRWFGGRFNPEQAFSSAAQAVWQFWSGQPSRNGWNLLFALFYLFGLLAAAYHFANGLATGLEVLGWAESPARQKWVGRFSLVLGPVLLLAGLVAWLALAGLR